MQVNTINKVIRKKLQNFLDSIKDEGLAQEVKENLLLSGGSITSMFLDMPVNDYDLYIQDRQVLIKLAKYYYKGRVLDGNKREEYLADWEVEEEFQETGEKFASEKYVRIFTLKPGQVKLDIASEGRKFEVDLEDENKYQVSFLSQNSISLTGDIQIVLRFSGKVEEIHKTFDFMHATNYFTYKDGLVLNQKALSSILTKELKYQGSLYPLTSIIRMKKFLKRGWNINAGEMLKIMFQISELDLKDPFVLEEQLIGVDVAYFSTLIEILRGTKREGITSGYLNTIIDKVFQQYEGEIEE